MAVRLTGIAEKRVARRDLAVEMVTVPPGRVTDPGFLRAKGFGKPTSGSGVSISIKSNWPAFEIGQRRGSCSPVFVLGSVAVCRTGSKARHSASFCLRLRLARKPKCRIRTKPEGEHVEEKTPNELHRIQRHRFALVPVGIILPCEGDAPIFQR
jgi:hypothetical protein